MIGAMAGVAAALTVAGTAQALAAARQVATFAARPRTQPAQRPAVTVLKPLHGNEPLLEDALATICAQDYPDFQIVFGVADAEDPAVAVVASLRARFPTCDIALVTDPRVHGENLKVGNLINMLPAAKHDILVIADSDVHAQPDYLDRLVAALEQPGTGLVTALYAGLPATPTTVAALGATQITHGFLPGAVLARALGRQDCLGATMCLRRRDLARIGGLRALVHHLADDNVLGRRVRDLGLAVALADTLVLTTVPETQWRALFRHELRWARTIRALEPAGFAASAVQHPLFWALLTVLLANAALWSIGLFAIAWVLRALAALGTERALTRLWTSDRPGGADEREEAGASPGPRSRHCLENPGILSGGKRGALLGRSQGPDRAPLFPPDKSRVPRANGPWRVQGRALAFPSAHPIPPDDRRSGLAFHAPVWLLPLRDVFSIAVMATSYGGRRVVWQGHAMLADSPPHHEAVRRPFEEVNSP
jgi:ceramide glucosyltransferase